MVSDCGVRIPDVIAISGYDRTAWRLRGLDTANRVRQAWCIDAAFACIGDGRHQTTGFAPGKGGRSAALGAVLLEDRPLRDRLLAAACCVGERLATLAFVDRETAGWHVLRQIDERYWSIESAGMDLYSGLPGIALFLAYLGRLTGDDRHAALTRSCVSTMRRVIALTRNVEKQIGGFEGWGGVLYVFCCLASALDDRSLIADAESIVDLLPALIEQDERLDMISGAAGCIGGLLCLHRAAPSPSTLAAAIACGERLLSRGQAMEQGMGWRTAIAPEHPLCGLSHGASGIGLALLELSTATDDPRFRAAAEQAFRYERSQRLREGGWRDLRQPRPDAGAAQPAVAPHATTAWCHGASGIGLARVRALAHGEDRDIREDLTAALADTMRDGFGHNHSLCHGDLGNLELLLQARMDPVEAWVRDALDRRLVEILESIARDGFHCATPGSVDTPGLMLGLAGIGYQLLRLADPACVPAVLLLEAPKLHERSEDR